MSLAPMLPRAWGSGVGAGASVLQHTPLAFEELLDLRCLCQSGAENVTWLSFSRGCWETHRKQWV